MNAVAARLKRWVVEAHTDAGDSASSNFAILKIDQTFVDMVLARTALMVAHNKAYGAQSGFPVPTGQEIFFEAPAQIATFDGGEENLGSWVLSMHGHENAAVSFQCAESDCISTGILVNELAEMFTNQADHEVKVYARPDYMEQLADNLEWALSRPGGQRPVVGEDRDTLKLARVACRIDIENDLALLAPAPGGAS